MNAVVSEQLPAVLPPQTGQQMATSAGDQSFNLAYRRAKAMSSASLVPAAYKNNIPNTMIALEMADRIGASAMQVMQNLHIIQGKPSWSSSFLIACVNASGRFSPMRFEEIGEGPKDTKYRVRAYASDKATGERCNGPWIDWEMVKAEKWLDKPGSKWKTMPGPMFMYRAAGFWSRLFAPEVSMGILTREEVEDVWAQVQPNAPTQHDTASLRALEADLTGTTTEPEPDGAPGVLVDPKEIRARLETAESLDELADAADLIREINDQDEREALTVLYDSRAIALQ